MLFAIRITELYLGISVSKKGVNSFMASQGV